jgi:hypothetical protein
MLSKIDRDAADSVGATFVAGLGVHLLQAELNYLKTHGPRLASGPSLRKTRKQAADTPAQPAGTVEL